MANTRPQIFPSDEATPRAHARQATAEILGGES
jgi:hypothetical protein